ncbi:MAG: aminotransferase class V-fold PLP-dependent enzyme [Candidatus Aminicenantaceae bacterium]
MDLNKNLSTIRKEFPVLSRCIYLISNSLGAVPKKTLDMLKEYYRLWAKEGVSAWDKEWWDLSRKVGNEIASLIGAGDDEVTMMTNATLGHWVALSTKFTSEEKERNRVIMTDLDFPSEIYAVTEIAKFAGWQLEIVKSNGQPGIDADEIIRKIDERTLFVGTSHVYFKSAYIQDISRISARAKEVGALTLIDGYHGPGTIPVDVKNLDVDFYVGGCLKWLCGGPGNAFLYVRPELIERLKPRLTGWLAHQKPFLFAQRMEYAENSYRFMAGTPPVPCLYTALPGVEVIKEIGISQIRNKSMHQTAMIIREAKKRGFDVFSPEEVELRGGAVSVSFDHAYAVKKALDNRGIKIDFRKGLDSEPDVIRIGPHFYTEDGEIRTLFEEIDVIFKNGEFKKYSQEIDWIT